MIVNFSLPDNRRPAPLTSADWDAGDIAGGALDVYDEEPLPVGHLLRSAPRTEPTPHLGYVTDDGYRTFYSGAAEDIAAVASGRPAAGHEHN
jgi:phosphoglycerate dehydrogenase-like enzyme